VLWLEKLRAEWA